LFGQEFLIWLAQLLASEKVKSKLGERGLKSDIVMLRKALKASQARTEELEGVADLLERVAAQRDSYFEELLRLRGELQRLNAELVRCLRNEEER
jgi:hypothetical protein